VIQRTTDAAALERAGRLAFPGFKLTALAATTSTQDVVRAAARGGAAPGFCCTADSQTAGRGRQSRRWIAPPGSALLFSVLVRVRHAHLGGVSIAAGLAVRAAIAASTGGLGRLKWPNDILAGDRKLAGILCEVEPAAPGDGTAVVIGAGVNVTVPSFPTAVAGVSLHELVDSPPSPSRLLAVVLSELADRLAVLENAGMAELRSARLDPAAGLGAVVTATSAAGSVTGVAEGIDGEGALLIRGEAGVVRVLAGDVHLSPGASSG
jgi:BirA family biotin operon repressor/biotin-[acetyl-CoA-carboxylase] ligase